MPRQPLSSEAKAAAIARLHEAMRKCCERNERWKAERDADELMVWWRRLCDEMGPNV